MVLGLETTAQAGCHTYGTVSDTTPSAHRDVSAPSAWLEGHIVGVVQFADVDAATNVIRAVMAEAAEPAISLSVPLGVEIGTGPNWGAAH